MIQASMDHELIEEKTRELCEVILNQPAFVELRKDVEKFLGDEESQEQYRAVSEQGRTLHAKQSSGQSLNPEEIEAFEKLRHGLLQNPVATAFLEAQQSMNEVQELVNQWLSKSFELGRVPDHGEMDCDQNGGCGSGGQCGCK